MKRTLSIILTLSIVATLFAGLGLNASAATNYAEKMTVTHSNYADGNLSLPTSGSVITKAPTVSYWDYDSAAGTTTHYKTWYNTAKSTADIAKLYDGNLANVFESAYASNNTNKYLKLKEGATAGSTTVSDYESIDDGSFYVQIQYDLEDCYGNGVDLDKIIIYGHQRFWTMGSYDLFISDNVQTLYDSPVYSYDYLTLNGSEIGAYANSKKNFTEYTFEEGTTAKFVAIRVYKCHAMTDAYFTNQCTSFGTLHARIGEFNVYGTRSTANNQGYELTTAPYNSTGGDTTLAAATAAGIGNNISTSLIRDYAPTEYKYSNLGASNTANVSDKTITQSNDFKRFDINTSVRFAGTDNKGYKYIIDNENNYQQWIYALDAAANIDSLVVATNYYGTSGIAGSLFAPYHVQYSLADNKDDLFVDGASTIYDVYNTDAAAFLTINLTEDVTAKFVGLRVVCGVNKLYPYTEYTALTGNNVAWARLSYFGVNGTYVNPAEANVTVAKDAAVADVDAITVSKGVPTQSGLTDTNGKFPVGSVKVTATESYEDEENLKLYTFKGWYNGEELVTANTEYTYDLTGGDIALTAKYDVEETTVKYTLTFVDASKTVVGTIVVEEGEIPSEDDVKAINAKVKDIYGYNVFVEDDMVVWDDDVFEAVTADKTFNACYKAVDMNTAVTIYKLDNKSEYEKHGTQKFDTAITLVCDGANSWTDEEDNVLVAAPTGTLYACGTKMKLYPVSTQLTADAVSFVGKEMKDGKFTVFAHAAPAAEVKAYGIIFASNTYKENYDKQTDKGDMFTLKDTAAINKVNPSLKVSEVNVTTEGVVDFMASLNGCGGKVRHARAYVTYTNGTTVYSDVIVTNN